MSNTFTCHYALPPVRSSSHWECWASLCWDICLFRLPFCVNPLWHTMHLCGFSPVWVSMWRCRFPNSENFLWHSEHSCCFSPVWVSMWYFKWLLTENFLWHSVHSCGFSSVWVCRVWRRRVPNCENVLWHSGHSCGFSSVWVCRVWRRRVPNCENVLWHSGHSYGFSPVWVSMWRCRVLNSENFLWHSEHSCGFSSVWVSMWRRKISRTTEYFVTTLALMCGRGSPSFLYLRCCTHSLLVFVTQWSFYMIMLSKMFIIINLFHRSTVLSCLLFQLNTKPDV